MYNRMSTQVYSEFRNGNNEEHVLIEIVNEEHSPRQPCY